MVKAKDENIEKTGPTIKKKILASNMIIAKDENIEKTGLTIKKKVAREAISVLKQLNEKFSESKAKKPLFDDSAESSIYLQVTLKKIPPKKMKRMIKIQLPHSLLTDTSEVCLITGDLDKRDKKAEIEPTIEHYKELLNKQGVKGIAEVVPLRQLRTEYKTYESKRQLSAAYDVFLNDKKITGVLPKVLGKAFYNKRKFPIQINLEATNLKEHVERAVSEVVFSISCLGNSCTSEVARISMADNEILENILTCVKSLEDKVPGKSINILGIYIKTAKSEAIPIYMTFDNANELKIKVHRRKELVKAEELSTMDNAVVKVFKDGKITVKKLPRSEDENSADEADVKPTIKRKKSSGQEEETDGEDDEESQINDENGHNPNGKQSKSKKRKIKKENNLVEDSPVMAEDVKSKIKNKKMKVEKLEDEETPDKQEAISKRSKKNSKSKRNKSAKDNSIRETNNKEEVTNDLEESKADIENSVQKKSNKRKSISIKNEPVADLNVNKKRLRSQSNKQVKIEASTVNNATDKLESDIQEETTVHVVSSAQKKTRKRKSKSLIG